VSAVDPEMKQAHFNTFDVATLALFVAAGLWLIVAPRSVQRLYARLKREPDSPFAKGEPQYVRIAGVLWLVIVLCAAFFAG
jgi:uncharacterized protein YjeT (DUF2065 family)